MKDEIRKFLRETIIMSDEIDFDDDSSFLEEGLFDSTAMMDLVFFVSDTYNIEVPDEDLNAENFDSINRTVNYIRRRQNQAEG